MDAQQTQGTNENRRFSTAALVGVGVGVAGAAFAAAFGAVRWGKRYRGPVQRGTQAAARVNEADVGFSDQLAANAGTEAADATNNADDEGLTGGAFSERGAVIEVASLNTRTETDEGPLLTGAAGSDDPDSRVANAPASNDGLSLPEDTSTMQPTMSASDAAFSDAQVAGLSAETASQETSEDPREADVSTPDTEDSQPVRRSGKRKRRRA